MTNCVLNLLRPIASPFYLQIGNAIMCIMKPAAITASQVFHIFDTKVYYLQLICVLTISLFLRYCRQVTKICKRGLLRQLFEIFLLATFEPKAFGLLKEKILSIRLILTAIILVGFLMRKTFCSKLNAMFAFENFDFVGSFGDDMARDKNLKLLYAVGAIPYHLVKENRKQYPMPTSITAVHKTLFDVTDFDMIQNLIRGNALVFGYQGQISTLHLTYPFLPLKISPVIFKWPAYNFPVSKYSPHFHKLYKILQRALDTGIYHFASRETDQIEQFKNKQGNKVVQRLYSESPFLQESSSFRKAKNCLQLSFLVLLIGIVVSSVFLMHEFICFRKQTKRFTSILEQ